MSRTIRRGAAPARRAPVRRPVKKAPLGDRMLAKLPVSEATLHRVVTLAMLGAAGVATFVVASWAGVPAMVGAGVGEAAARAGLRVEQVDITGLKRMSRETVYKIAVDEQASKSMLRIDLAQIRARLMEQGWVQDAYVTRRLPDHLLIHVVEREPAAIWQANGQLRLIDATGRMLAEVDRDAMPDLPLVIGAGADQQEAGYQALLAAAPALRPRIRAASWVGNRRWDLTFDTGETLALPQDGAADALVKFAELDGARVLLGKGWLRFDMRDPTKLVARRPGEGMRHVVPDDGTSDEGKDKTSEARAGERAPDVA